MTGFSSTLWKSLPGGQIKAWREPVYQRGGVLGCLEMKLQAADCSNHVKSSLNTCALDTHLSAREGWSVLFVFFTVTGQFVFVQVGHSNGNCSLLWWTRAAYANKTRDGREKRNNNRNESLTWQISYEESDPLGGQDKSGAKQCGSSSLFNTTLIAVSNKTGN